MKKILLVLGLFFLLCPMLVSAAEFQSSASGNLTIAKESTPKNLYVAASIVDSDANITGDLVAAGEVVNINGNVEDDVFAAAKTINSHGDIGGNARFVASSIAIDGNIDGDMLAGGQIIKINKDSVIGGDLVIAGTSLVVDGTINGNITLTGENITINGLVNGNVTAKNIGNLKIGDEAKITGKLKYSSNKVGEISSKAVITQGTEFEKVEQKTQGNKPQVTAFITSLLIGFVTLLVAIYLFPLLSKKTVETSIASFGPSIGWGLFTLIVIPLIALAIMITFLGVKIGAIVGIIYLILLLLASIYSSLIVGSMMVRAINKTKEYPITWISALVGTAALLIMGLVPIIGWLTVFLFFLMSLGSLSMQVLSFVKTQKS